MKFKEQLAKDRAAMAGLDRQGKLQFLWDYYKIPALAVVCAVFLVVITVVSLKRLTLIETLRRLELTLTLFKITSLFLRMLVSFVAYTSNGEKQPKQS